MNNKALIAACNKNLWLQSQEYSLTDYPYAFIQVSTTEELLHAVTQGNDAIRTGYLYEHLAFVQQVNGEDEWLALTYADGTWTVFDSISFGIIFQNHGEKATLDYVNTLVDKMNDTLSNPIEGGMDLC